MDLESRIDEQEGQIDALLDDIDARDKQIREIEAQCAAMREALEDILSYPADGQKAMSVVVGMFETARHVLQDTTAGADLLERLEKAEAERVTPLNREQLWQYVFVNTGVGVDELDGIIGHLILNDHIREAE